MSLIVYTYKLKTIINKQTHADIDECLTNNGGCGDPITANCTNTYASFYCQCTTGYNGTPPLCTGTYKFVRVN